MWLNSVGLFLILGSTLQEECPILKTALGTIKGHYKYSHEKRMFSAFEGIPYAKPPIGDLRFAEPQNAEPWPDVLETTVIHECSQLPTAHLADKNEDCLYINVYVPRQKPIPKENLDVIVHIHGGAFMVGSPTLGGPEYLMDRDIVYVNLNYRLGLFGFLSTADEVVPGNNGLKDQVLALKWIQTNIEYFGGNPNSVTITGLSAGGASVHFHYFSPLSRGLFHRGISQSGTALAPWVINSNPFENVVRLGKAVGCVNPSTRELIECLRTISAQTLCEALPVLSESQGFPIAPFAPVVEQLRSQTAFLTDHPYKLLQTGMINDLPWIASMTTDEGMMCLIFLKNDLTPIEEQWSKYLPDVLNYKYTVSDADKPIVADRIKKFYFQNDTLTEKAFVKLCGDRYFGISLEKSTRMQAKISKSPVYAYIYGYKADQKSAKLFGVTYDGVNHGDDSNLLYDVTFLGINLRSPPLSERDNFMKDFLVNSVTSFAKPNHTNIHWKSVKGTGDFRYMFIKNKHCIGMKYDKEIGPTEFWNSLPIKEFDKMSQVKIC